MPQATDEQHREWNGPSSESAIRYLQSAGYILRRDWHWRLPSASHVPTEKEISAIRFLIDEWDFGGIAR